MLCHFAGIDEISTFPFDGFYLTVVLYEGTPIWRKAEGDVQLARVDLEVNILKECCPKYEDYLPQ